MERALSQDERIRRAEEIYARRQSARERTSRATVNISSSKPRNFKLFKRILLQAFICVLIYFIFHLINTTNYSFSTATLDKTEELISDEIDFIGIYNNIVETISGYITSLNMSGKNNENDGVLVEENKVEEGVTDENSQANEINQTNENTIIENIIENSETEQSESENVALINNEENTSQEEIKDIELSETDRIKQKYSFIVPVKRVDII